MEQEFSLVVLLFFSYSFIGWLWETVYCGIKARHFVYRGFLLGPITPIYGFGVIGVLYLIDPFQKNIFLLFGLSFILCTILEYITSFLLEKIFHLTLWDYKKVPLNINGRVAVPVSIFWGAACVFIVRVLNPHLMTILEGLYARFSIFLPVLLLMLISADTGFTLANVSSLRRRMTELSGAIQEKKTQLQTDVNQRLDTLKTEAKERQTERKEWLEAFKDPETRKKLPKLNLQERRFLNAFPTMKSSDLKSSLPDIRQVVKTLREK
ncbi:putative ABC transporter permease [Enterococcus alishanensis]|uniref:ABC transporter permease n=1 Tax=Enterococcus alishanensis TaxID=1303817 RepID=A0ABS6TFK4_9ENTE|nr:putative ABC transporter permease [Enterococcus alishanensis]MBV7391691.1 putative ABC transporter permease [Enterococcus alishanensis]